MINALSLPSSLDELRRKIITPMQQVASKVTDNSNAKLAKSNTEFKIDPSDGSLIFYDYDLARDGYKRGGARFLLLHIFVIWVASFLIWPLLMYLIYKRVWVPIIAYACLILYTYAPIKRRRERWQAVFFYGLPKFFKRSSFRITSPELWPDLQPVLRRLNAEPAIDMRSEEAEATQHGFNETSVGCRVTTSGQPIDEVDWDFDQVVKEVISIPHKPRIWMAHPHGFLALGWSQMSFNPYFSGVYNCWSTVLYYIGNLATCYSSHLANPFPVTASTMHKILRSGGSLTVIPGGFEEATINSNDSDRIFLSTRFGIFKMALEHGADLIPYFAFGETMMHRNVQGYWRARLWLSANSIPAILPWGRFFNYPYDEMHHIVTGRPIPVDKIESPTKSQISDLKDKYIEELKALHALYAPVFYGKEVKLEVW